MKNDSMFNVLNSIGYKVAEMGYRPCKSSKEEITGYAITVKEKTEKDGKVKSGNWELLADVLHKNGVMANVPLLSKNPIQRFKRFYSLWVESNMPKVNKSLDNGMLQAYISYVHGQEDNILLGYLMQKMMEEKEEK